MTARKLKILIYGYGNPGRQDDGLGVELAEEMGKWAAEQKLICIHTESDYQLNLEDAAGISVYDIVIFADASKEKSINDINFELLKPSADAEFTMHAVAPAFILYLCTQVFDRKPETYLLHIKGYEWEFMAEITAEARKNLDLACSFLKKFILEKLK